MRNRILLLTLLLGALLAASADAEVYRIVLRGKARLLSADTPVVARGAVLFHDFSSGRLRSVSRAAVERIVAVPQSQILGFLPASERTDEAIAPTSTVYVGPTGADYEPPERRADGMGTGEDQYSADPGRLDLEAQVFPGDLPGPGMYGYGYGYGSAYGSAAARRRRYLSGLDGLYRNGSPRSPLLSARSDLRFGRDRVAMTVGPEAGGLPINPNGFPATTLDGPQSGIQPIGPDGYPSLAFPPIPPSRSGHHGGNRSGTR